LNARIQPTLEPTVTAVLAAYCQIIGLRFSASFQSFMVAFQKKISVKSRLILAFIPVRQLLAADCHTIAPARGF